MSCIFITGTPNAGKSTLAKKVSQTMGVSHHDLDDLRVIMSKDLDLRKWITFFNDQDEQEYWRNTSADQHFQNIVQQSEAFWPTFLKKIKDVVAENQSAIFEAVNILPHLARRDLPCEGVVLVYDSEEETFERLRKRPRWSEDENLQKVEARRFVEEAAFYKAEAEKYKYPCFTDPEETEHHVLGLLKK